MWCDVCEENFVLPCSNITFASDYLVFVVDDTSIQFCLVSHVAFGHVVLTLLVEFDSYLIGWSQK